MISRLIDWAFRRKVIICWIAACPNCKLKRSARTVWIPHNRCPSCGSHIPTTYRSPTFAEAVTGVSN